VVGDFVVDRKAKAREGSRGEWDHGRGVKLSLPIIVEEEKEREKKTQTKGYVAGKRSGPVREKGCHEMSGLEWAADRERNRLETGRRPERG
jgi:hypothetical protein